MKFVGFVLPCSLNTSAHKATDVDGLDFPRDLH